MSKKWFVLSVLAVFPALSTGCTGDSTLTISNQSSFVLTDIAVGEVGGEFGPNLIEGDTLLPKEELVVELACGTYDALVKDDSGVQGCQLGELDLCFDDAIWVLDDLELEACGFTSSLTISNKSTVALTDIAVAMVGAPDFGPNLIAGDVLLPGEELVVHLNCGTYDALVNDDSGAPPCQLGAIDICGGDKLVWTIDDILLQSCGFSPVTPESLAAKYGSRADKSKI